MGTGSVGGPNRWPGGPTGRGVGPATRVGLSVTTVGFPSAEVAPSGSPSSVTGSTRPVARVAPRLRSRPGWSSSPITTWRTAWCVRSIERATTPVPTVATTLPTATPMTVPFTPKLEAMTAARTAPTADAMIWIGLIFMGRSRSGAADTWAPGELAARVIGPSRGYRSGRATYGQCRQPQAQQVPRAHRASAVSTR